MKIIRAKHLGMCFGVRDAISLAEQHTSSEPPTILGELVHNQTVIESLQERGIRIENEVDRVKTDTVMITAHGASERRMHAVRRRGLNVIEATCPLVHVAHKAVRKLVSAGYHPVIVGKHGHVEVRGLTEDLDDYDVVLTEDDIRALKPRPRFGIAAQTTQPISRVRRLVDVMHNQFPESEVHFIDTVCHPTKQRQTAAEELAKQADVIVVIGGANSNNTRELAETCRRFGAQVHKVQGPNELCEDWFGPDDTVGITAGTSTPDTLIDGVEKWLQRLAQGKAEPLAVGR